MKRGLLLLLLVALPLFAQAPAEEVAATAVAHDVFNLTPAAPSATRTIVVDATEAFSISLTAASQNLQVRLTAPDGTQHFVGDADSETFESGLFPIDGPPAGATYLATALNPQTGAWTLQITQPGGLTAPLSVVSTTLLNNDTRAVLVGGGDTYPLDTPTRLALVVFDGTEKVRNLTVAARFFRAEAAGTPAALDFRDDGTGADTVANDGIYEVLASATQAGRWQVLADVTGTASTGAFKRTVTTEFVSVARKANIDGVFTDRGIDLDGDTLLDQIGITPRATVLENGTYNIGVRLVASNGNEIFQTIEHDLTAGPVAPEVLFATEDVARELGVNGPYAVAEVRFLLVVGDDLVPADIRYNLGNTAAYQLGTFQRERLRLSGNGSATGVDFNGNGLYDQLDVTVEVLADFAGTYQFSGRLADANGKELGFRTGTRFFNAGANQLTFSFAGFPIGLNGVDGPYVLSNLLLFGSGESLVEDTAFTTPAFTASQFEGYANDQEPPVLNVSVTPSVIYPPNHQMVEITPTVSVTDNRDADPVVDLVSITSNEGDDVRGDGSTSPDVSIAGGRIFVRAERSGLAEGRIYTITWRARDDSGNTSTASATVTVPHDQKQK
jgi:hypothetical protein